MKCFHRIGHLAAAFLVGWLSANAPAPGSSAGLCQADPLEPLLRLAPADALALAALPNPTALDAHVREVLTTRHVSLATGVAELLGDLLTLPGGLDATRPWGLALVPDESGMVSLQSPARYTVLLLPVADRETLIESMEASSTDDALWRGRLHQKTSYVAFAEDNYAIVAAGDLLCKRVLEAPKRLADGFAKDERHGPTADFALLVNVQRILALPPASDRLNHAMGGLLSPKAVADAVSWARGDLFLGPERVELRATLQMGNPIAPRAWLLNEDSEADQKAELAAAAANGVLARWSAIAHWPPLGDQPTSSGSSPVPGKDSAGASGATAKAAAAVATTWADFASGVAAMAGEIRRSQTGASPSGLEAYVTLMTRRPSRELVAALAAPLSISTDRAGGMEGWRLEPLSAEAKKSGEAIDWSAGFGLTGLAPRGLSYRGSWPQRWEGRNFTLLLFPSGEVGLAAVVAGGTSSLNPSNMGATMPPLPRLMAPVPGAESAGGVLARGWVDAAWFLQSLAKKPQPPASEGKAEAEAGGTAATGSGDPPRVIRFSLSAESGNRLTLQVSYPTALILDALGSSRSSSISVKPGSPQP